MVGQDVPVQSIVLTPSLFRNMFSSEKVLQMSYANYQFVLYRRLIFYLTLSQRKGGTCGKI